jgi:hypothetical protein
MNTGFVSILYDIKPNMFNKFSLSIVFLADALGNLTIECRTAWSLFKLLFFQFKLTKLNFDVVIYNKSIVILWHHNAFHLVSLNEINLDRFSLILLLTIKVLWKLQNP